VELDLLHKTELKIYGMLMDGVNLTKVASVVADVLGLPEKEVLVVDVRQDHICLDILAKGLDMRQIAGKETILLNELKTVAGLDFTPEAYVDSAGILGIIGCAAEDRRMIVDKTEKIIDEISQTILKRALVYSTGFEVMNGMIKDTNSPYLLGLLEEQGYKAEFGGVLEDDFSVIAHKLRDAADRGYGLVLTTGGVGAEDKDYSIEALTCVDREAATPWIVKFQKGTGRHVKEGVRIAVGQSGLTTYISLPGPHDEVVAAGAALRQYCNTGKIEKELLANEIAQILRDKLRQKQWHCKNHNETGE